MVHIASLLLGMLATLVAVTCRLPAQDDLRDVVTLKNGDVLRGRVFARYEAESVTLQVGRRRQQIPRADVVGMDTVRDRMREFFRLLDRLPDNLKHRWYMAQWAADRDLPDLARLVALDVVLRDPDHEGAHTLLGNRNKGGQWRWQSGDEWTSLAELEDARSHWGHRWQIDSEHFHVESTAELRRVVDALWDLERFHLVWFEQFSDALRLCEVVGPKMNFEIWRDERRFVGMRTVTGRVAGKTPYYRQRGWEVTAVARTYFADVNAERPVGVFEVATSHLLYRTVADDPNVASVYRPAAWAELGLARYLQRRMTGPAGVATLGPWHIDAAEARIVLDHPERDLDHVAQFDTKKYYLQVSDDNLFEWPAAELAVAWLLESGQQSGLRNGLFGYLEEVLRKMLGTSSVVLDRHLGQPVQQLDKPWRAWIKQQVEAATQAAPSTKPAN
ncbi:MAG TPA: hypothetical protein VF384_16335 [Planctomycetota bacterium]